MFQQLSPKQVFFTWKIKAFILELQPNYSIIINDITFSSATSSVALIPVVKIQGLSKFFLKISNCSIGILEKFV